MAEHDVENTSGLTRRDFMKLGVITAATLAVPVVLTNVRAKSMQLAVKEHYDTDVLVIGSGFAGTFAAIEARRNGLKVLMLDKGSVGWSGLSPWASDSRPFDKSIYGRDEWVRNMATNTEWINDREWLEIFMDESLDIFTTLDGWGVHNHHPFERSKIFRQQLLDNEVELVERVMATSLLKDSLGRVGGAVGFTFDDSSAECKAVVIKARSIILCTGAGAYKSPGFPNWGLTFDGDAMAYAAGASITGKEFHDTHGTFSKNPAASYGNWDWAQAVKGAYIMVGPPGVSSGGLTIEDALRVAASGARFESGMGPPPPPPAGQQDSNNEQYRGKGFLAKPGLILDFGGAPSKPPSGGLPPDRGNRVGGATAGMGVHKSEGVFNSDHTCRADGAEGLFAAGDALGSMLCGSSYPARGFSSYGSAIQGRRAARFAAEYLKTAAASEIDNAEIDTKIAQIWAPRENKEGFSPEWVTQVLRNTMSPFHVLYIKEARRLDGALASIEYLRKHVVPKLIARDGHELRLAHETANMVLNAEMKLRAGLFRTESRGTHFREDYPARDDAEWFCWVLIRQGDDGQMELAKHDLPEAWKPDGTVSYRERYPRSYPGEDEYLASKSIG